MDKNRIKALLSQFGVPVLITALGLILMAAPDSATALVTTIIGWVLVVLGAGKAITMANRRGSSSVAGWLVAAAGVVLGVFLLKNPLIIAEAIGRLLGIILAVRGIQDISDALKLKSAGCGGKGSLILGIVMLAVGALLALLPMTLTRTLLRLCGLVVVIIGGADLVEKLRQRRLPPSGGDPNIIDADE